MQHAPKPGNAAGEVASVPRNHRPTAPRGVGRFALAANIRALRHRNFGSSLPANWFAHRHLMQNTAQGWLVYQLTGSNCCSASRGSWLSADDAVFHLGGSVADRHPKRQIVPGLDHNDGFALLFAAL